LFSSGLDKKQCCVLCFTEKGRAGAQERAREDDVLLRPLAVGVARLRRRSSGVIVMKSRNSSALIVYQIISRNLMNKEEDLIKI
jgi:hypothetical protein